jgi:hypothetical protein
MSKIALEGNASGSGTLTIAAPNTNSNFTLSLPTNTGTIITQNSTPAFASTIGVGGATAAASGAGITFPATMSASSNANTLDDYEEGTFTPSFLRSTTNPTLTYDQQDGFYTKIGNFVFFAIRLGVNTVSSQGSADLWVGGLPFAPATSAAGDVGLAYAWDAGSNVIGAKWFTSAGQTYLIIYKDDNAAGQYSGNLFTGGGSRMFFYGHYRV